MNKWWGWALAALVAVALPARADVDLEQYLRREGFIRVKISPDGLHYAATVHWQDRIGLVVMRRSDQKIVSSAVGDKGSEIESFWWANSERVVLSTAESLGSRDQPYSTGQLFALGLDSDRLKPLTSPVSKLQLAKNDSKSGWQVATMIDTLPADPRHVLVAMWDATDTNPKTHVDSVDVYSGSHKRVATAPTRAATFATDTQGEVRFAVGHDKDNFSELYYRQDPQSEWRLINSQAESGRIETPLGFARDGVTAYLQVTQPSGPDAIVAFNTASGERKEVLRHASADPLDVVYDSDERTVIGAHYMADTVTTKLIDETSTTARLQRALERAFPGSAVQITSFTQDGGLALVQVWNDRTHDTYLFDTKTMAAAPVLAQRPWMDRARLAPSRQVELTARDGMKLYGYLTLPRGATASQPLPMVVMPHGGPYGIFDRWSYDDDTQLLADAGYAVLRLNFRGSGNHGRSYQVAGAREWGGKMQDDVTDATRWAIDQKIADPSKICIYGASYGGYAALMGVAREPALYRCAAGYVGVYDLEAMHRQDSRDSRYLRLFMEDWVGERSSLDARSPVLLADRIKVPVLLAAGGEDRVAPIAHSQKMELALHKAGVPVETLYFDTEGHGFYAQEHQREFYVRLLDFLGRHLGGARAAAAGTSGAKGKPGR
ncbi:alpha/beta hydrolase family protein [Agrilutibacter solisilvae]|uniref:S9 family peptidase n=1 Tax=Agrilutibacter solisilvae TaxID=2763317 RepID=A0A974XZX7_9GAMM|nr:S9 family peptidase [Lysobacter solisilvae]QSX78866.1 S9 family peptidase [Lysobacter solisilvae]